jgi:hypothetical protein
MSYDEMVEGYHALYRGLVEDRGIADRIREKLRHFGDPPEHSTDSWRQQLGIVARLLVRGVAPGGLGRVAHFLRSLPWTRPRLFPVAIGDWVVGLTMRDFVDRQRLAATDAEIPSSTRANSASESHGLLDTVKQRAAKERAFGTG